MDSPVHDEANIDLHFLLTNEYRYIFLQCMEVGETGLKKLVVIVQLNAVVENRLWPKEECVTTPRSTVKAETVMATQKEKLKASATPNLVLVSTNSNKKKRTKTNNQKTKQTVTQRRVCDNLKKYGKGRDCYGDSEREIESVCNTQPCPSKWSIVTIVVVIALLIQLYSYSGSSWNKNRCRRGMAMKRAYENTRSCYSCKAKPKFTYLLVRFMYKVDINN